MEWAKLMNVFATYLWRISEFCITMSKVTFVSHDAITVVVKVPASLCFELVVDLLLTLLILVVILKSILHHHHVLIHHHTLLLRLHLLVRLDILVWIISDMMSWLVPTSILHLNLVSSWDVIANISLRVIERVVINLDICLILLLIVGRWHIRVGLDNLGIVVSVYKWSTK